MILINNVKIINPQEINTLSIEVTEEIPEENFESFCETNLQLAGFDPNYKTKIITVFQPKFNKYEIYFFDCAIKCVTIFGLISKFLENNFQNCNLLLAIYTDALEQKYLIVYENSQLFLFKKISNQTTQMTIAMFEKKYQTKIDTFCEINKSSLNETNIENINEKFLKVKKSPFFLGFITLNFLFIFGFVLILLFYENNDQKNLNSQISQTKEKIIQFQSKQKSKDIVAKIENLCNILSSNEILVYSISYEKGEIKFLAAVDSQERMKIFFENPNLKLIKTEKNKNENIKFVAQYF